MKRILFAAAFAALAASAEGGGWVRTETALGPGVTRIDLRRETPPCDVRMVAFDRSALPDLRFHVRQAGGGTISPTHEVGNYPRTLVGLGPGKIVLFVADGRSSRSKSLPSREAAALLAAEGCTDAVQFDGGGSTTLLAGGEVLNRPSDGRPRKVAEGLFLTLPAR